MRYRTHVDPATGRTIKSGLNMLEDGEQPDYAPRFGVYRAIVLRTFATDDPVRTEGQRKNTTRLRAIECDILLTRSLVFFPRVPVLHRQHGVSDADLWVPRPTTRAVGGKELNLRRTTRRGALQSLPPNLEDLDGEQVLVQFIEGDPEKPVIMGAQTHGATNRLVVDGAGWAEAEAGSDRGTPHLNERYARYRGVEFRVNDQGDVLLDTVGATADEEETPAALGGQVRVRVKGTERLTVEIDGNDVLEIYRVGPGAAGLRVDLVEGAEEQYVRGTTFAAALNTFLSACTTLSTILAVQAAAMEIASVGPLAAFKVPWGLIGNAFSQWGGVFGLPPGVPIAGSTVIPVDPSAAAVGIFQATLVTGQALSGKIRGD